MSLNVTSDEFLVVRQDQQPRRRRSWRRGGSSTARWGHSLLGVCLVGLGLAVVTAVALPSLLPAIWATTVTTLAVWAILAAPVIVGLSRSIPRGLFRIRPEDLLYGLVLGVLLRVAQGLLETLRLGSSASVPSYPTVDGVLPAERMITDVVSGVLIGPLVEEMFFRCALLVAVYSVCRRRWGAGAGRWAAVVLPAALFVASHALISPMSLDGAAAVALLGLICGLLVVRTGRIWAAVLVHATYNGVLLLVFAVGTLSS